MLLKGRLRTFARQPRADESARVAGEPDRPHQPRPERQPADELPEWLGNLTALTSLDLSGNRLTELPEWLGNLTALTSLDLSGNGLTSLPEWLGNLTALTRLDLSGNQLTELPEWLGNLTALTSLDLIVNRWPPCRSGWGT